MQFVRIHDLGSSALKYGYTFHPSCGLPTSVTANWTILICEFMSHSAIKLAQKMDKPTTKSKPCAHRVAASPCLYYSSPILKVKLFRNLFYLSFLTL